MSFWICIWILWLIFLLLVLHHKGLKTRARQDVDAPPFRFFEALVPVLTDGDKEFENSRRRGRRRSAEACSKQRFYQDLPYYFIQKRNEMINPEVRPEKFDGQEVGRPTWCHLLSEKSIDSFAESRHKRPVNKKL